MSDSFAECLAGCEAARDDLDDPLERLNEAVADEDQYEVDSLIRECVDLLSELQDACATLSGHCTRSRLPGGTDAKFVQQELGALARELKSIGRSGSEGEELQDVMEAWNDSFEDCDASLSDLLTTLQAEKSQAAV